MCLVQAGFPNDFIHKKRITVCSQKNYKQLKILILYKKGYIFVIYVIHEGSLKKMRVVRRKKHTYKY